MHCLCCLSLLSLCLPVSFLPRSRSLPWFPAQSASLCWSSVRSAPPRWSSAQVWRSSVPSAQPWWAPVPSAPPGGLQSRLLHPGGLQFTRLCPGFPLCLGPRPLHFHVDLALCPSPAPPLLHRPPGLYRSVWKPLLGGGGLCHES